MLPERPRFPSQPCPTCGTPVDTIRAPRVLWLEDGVRFLCGDACRARFLDGARAYDRPSLRAVATSRAERPSIPDLVREATRVRTDEGDARNEGASERAIDPWIALGASVIAVGLLLFGSGRELGWAAAAAIMLSAALNARSAWTTLGTRRALGLAGPAGLVLATWAATASSPDSQRFALLGAAVAAVLVSSRGWVARRAARPVRDAADTLRATLPSSARIPAATPSAYEQVAASSLRPGDLTVVLEGERAPADGLVEEGAGIGLRYPEAAHSKPFRPGEFILAGTRIVEGAVTLRVRRTGQQRGLVRATDLGNAMHGDRGPVSRVWLALARWSWVVVGPMALAFGVGIGPGAAATVLLGLPLFAWIASLDAPMRAGSVAAARRGMFVGSARALADAGRVQTTGILLRGALTAGEPVVQRVIPLGDTKTSRVIALAAAAERAAGDHPVARAIAQHAEEEGYRKAAVRKERTVPGLGVMAVTARGVPVVVGRRQLLLDEGISVAAADQDATHIENEGLTPIFVAIDGNLEALMAILDPTHVGAPDAIRRIADLPSEVVILSGDDRRTVERIASNLGASRVKAPLLPLERVTEVQALRETGGLVAVIGRGGEDDAVLAAADVPLSLQIVGTTLEDRGIVVGSRDVRDAAGALWIARAVRRATWRSAAATSVVALGVVVGAALGGMSPALAALLAVTTEAWGLRAGSRLLRRVDLRVPMQQ